MEKGVAVSSLSNVKIVDLEEDDDSDVDVVEVEDESLISSSASTIVPEQMRISQEEEGDRERPMISIRNLREIAEKSSDEEEDDIIFLEDVGVSSIRRPAPVDLGKPTRASRTVDVDDSLASLEINGIEYFLGSVRNFKDF